MYLRIWAGELESPVYAHLGMTDKLKGLNWPRVFVDELYIKQTDF